MKKITLFAILLLLASCTKPTTEPTPLNRAIQGNWTLEKANIENNGWNYFPSNEAIVTISDTFVSNPWNSSYTVYSNYLHFNNGTDPVKVEFKGPSIMLWTSGVDSLYLKR